MRKIPKTAQETRNKKIASLASKEGGKSYTEIGKMFNISPQRVSQISQHELLKEQKCPHCGHSLV